MMSDSNSAWEGKNNAATRSRAANTDENSKDKKEFQSSSQSVIKTTKEMTLSPTFPWIVMKKYIRQKVAIPILIFLSKRNVNGPSHEEERDERKLRRIPIITKVANYYNSMYQQYYKIDSSVETDKQWSIDEVDVMVGLVGLGCVIVLTPLFVTLYVHTRVLQKTLLQLGGTWLYPMWITYSHLEHYAYEKVGFFILVWIGLCFFQCMEQNYLYFKNYPHQNHSGLSFTYIIIKTSLLHILLHPKWEFIVPIIHALTNHKKIDKTSLSETNDDNPSIENNSSTDKIDESRKPWSLDWENILNRRRLSREKMTNQAFSFKDDTKHGNTKRFCEEKVCTHEKTDLYQVRNIDDSDVSVSDSSCDDDNFSYVHVEEGENTERMDVKPNTLALEEENNNTNKNSAKKSPSSPMSILLSKINRKNTDANVENQDDINVSAVPSEMTTPQKDNVHSSSQKETCPDKIEDMKK